MTINVSLPALKNAKALVVGITNEHSNAYGCPALFRAQGAIGELADIMDSDSYARISPRPMRGGYRSKRYLSTAASTLWPKHGAR